MCFNTTRLVVSTLFALQLLSSVDLSPWSSVPLSIAAPVHITNDKDIFICRVLERAIGM